MLPRVAFEYGQTVWATRTTSLAVSASATLGSETSSVDAEVKAAFPVRRQRHFRVDPDVSRLDLGATAGDRQRALEAGGVADGEQLLGVRAAALSAHLGREAQVDLQDAVAGAAVPVDTPARDMRFGRVDRVRHRAAPPRLGFVAGCYEVRRRRVPRFSSSAVASEDPQS